MDNVDLAQSIWFVAFGLFVGIYGTMVGAGGGFLIVPMLRLIYGASPQVAVGTSLAVVFLNAASATFSYARLKRIDYHSGLRLAAVALPGAIVGAFVSQYLTSAIFNVLFGLLLVTIATIIAFTPTSHPSRAGDSVGERGAPRSGLARRVIVDKQGRVLEYNYDERAALFVSFGVGFLANTFGIGGGIIHVPAMVRLFGFPIHVATATSHLILGITVGVGAIMQLTWGNVAYLPAALLGVGVVAGAQVGAPIAQRVQGRWLIWLLSLALAFVGLRMALGGP